MEWPAHLPIVGGGVCHFVILSLVEGKHLDNLLLIS